MEGNEKGWIKGKESPRSQTTCTVPCFFGVSFGWFIPGG